VDGKIEVVEIFWYGCPHCYSFEPHLDKWLQTKPDDIIFVRMPGVLNAAWVQHARAYYTAEKLGVLDKIHRPLFDAIHRDRKRIFSEDELHDFFVERGVDGADFDRVYRSNEIDTRVKQALVMARAAHVTGVPAIIINGRYMTTGSLTGSFERLLEVTDRLAGLERDRLAAASAPTLPGGETEPAQPAPPETPVAAAASQPATPATETPSPTPSPVAVADAGSAAAPAPVEETPAPTAPAGETPVPISGKAFFPYLIIVGLLALVAVVIVLKGRSGRH
jgi:thiol:disulfide interchange protein DsbA